MPSFNYQLGCYMIGPFKSIERIKAIMYIDETGLTGLKYRHQRLNCTYSNDFEVTTYIYDPKTIDVMTTIILGHASGAHVPNKTAILWSSLILGNHRRIWSITFFLLTRKVANSSSQTQKRHLNKDFFI